MTLRLAFAGTGFINQIHAKSARKLENVELAAVVNHQQESMDQFAAEYAIPRKYLLVEDLIQDGGIDALIVGTPNALHAPQTIAALQAGMHVLVEKPMAMNADEAKAMVSAAESHDALLMVAHCWRFEPQVRWLKKQMQSGQIGDIVRTKGYGVHVQWGPSGWFTKKNLAGGGALADMGVHAIDTVRFLMNDPLPASVYARVGTYYQNSDVDDTAVLMINWNNGAFSVIESGWWQPQSDGLHAATQIYGTKGFARIFPSMIQVGEEIEQRPLAPEANYQEMYDVQMAAFVESVRLGLDPKPDGRQGLINMRIIDAAYESASTGRVVAFQ